MPLPPLNGLVALEATARLGSVSLAANELGISQPAISQRLRTLERHFGRKLIARTSTGFHMEADVEAFAARLRFCIKEVQDASAAFRAESHQLENCLTVSLLATFAQRWLIPRLFSFQQKYPHIDVRLMTTSSPSDLDRREADVSIRCGAGDWPGNRSEFIVANRIFPVASPVYLENVLITEPADLREATWIRVTASPRDHDWSRWLIAFGNEDVLPNAWQNYSNSTHAMEAATAGLGVAMAHSPFATDSLSSGRLIKLFSSECDDTDGDYYLVYKAAVNVPRRVSQFCDWLIENRGE